ncbi:MAG: gluconate 2-dehydrogenase subunit 3 family protein [Nitrospira sp.]|nr:gluconate 2-dehydrogenase subunit 3 family protein [Nitrospira sp.]
MHKHPSRRTLLKWTGLGLLGAGVGPGLAWLINRSGHHLSSAPEPLGFSDPVLVFTAYEAAVLHEVTGFIIPTDHDPGAKEAKVILELDRLAQKDDRFLSLCRQGVRWLDDQASSRYDQLRFLDLSPEQCESILSLGDSSERSFLGKVWDKLYYGHSRIAFNFFQRIRRLTFSIFYSQPLGWKVVGYEGPPQFSGNLDYHLCD